MFTQVEVEMEPDEKNIVESPLQEIVSLVDEEEVVLYWKESNTWKYIRELASDDADESKETLAYYRPVCYCHPFTDMLLYVSVCKYFTELSEVYTFQSRLIKI